ncbi:hypothetical protein C8035_v012311 [Colletotrichum spinosum]|uniref:Uncharacterized protein n=1 Tax=Colletotrichum spinosum TaxID=1347390 RepID=A0A4R8Q1J1_9PEZI|nr:hypothetical protein C8035_v012311 [Colletotrichum spinosum]
MPNGLRGQHPRTNSKLMDTLHAGSKKDRKNAKDGAVSAAVTKLAAGKFANGSPTKSPASNASSPPVNSPDIRPIAPGPSPYDGHPTVSPTLDALSTTSVSASTTTSTNHEWPRGGLAGSPGNLISLMGESPPTQPSSYEDSGRLQHGWTVQRQSLTPQTASPSPPNSMPNHMKRPLSFQMDAQYPLEAYQQPAAAAAYRRMSMQSHLSHARVGSQPPLPHQPQPHFYSAPDIDFDMASKAGMKAGDKNYHFGFDVLPSSHSEFVPGSDNVALAGYEGGLEIYSVTKRGLDRVAGIKGLRGGVYNAKVLPWSFFTDKDHIGPLVAVVVHGPVLPQASPDIAIQAASEHIAEESAHTPGSPRADGSQKAASSGRYTPTIEFYQTTVEVYSLKTGKLVDVLLQAPKVPLSTPVTSPIFQAPPPTGAFIIKADAGSIAVASGTSGECWLYRQIPDTIDGQGRFGCVGKLWTSLQQPPRGEVSEDGERRHSPAPPRPNPQTPILSLNGKWIAYCPPAASSQISLRAHIPIPVLGKAPGISSVTSPVLPAITGSVDSPMSESMVNKIMRETTQELISGAKWVGQQGLQAWNSYWNKNASQAPSQQSRSPPLTSQQWTGSYPPRHDVPQFPPTHGTPGQAVTKDPGLVSILDLDGLPASATLHPLITFASPLGCSFLSFSPTGLSLFTASGKGDVQTVWDLMCLQYTKSSPLQVSATNNAMGPRVRQVAQFSRMTVARIVEVAWSKPNGERIAMVTERGTVHLLDMPSSAFTWPPPRRRKATEENGAPASDAPSSAVSIASSAFGAAYHAARPLITRPRRSSANAQGLAGGNFVDSASVGGRALAASITHSIGKTGVAINQLRHTGENRVSLPQSPSLPAASCVVWITGRKYHTLYVVGDGVVRSFPSKTRRPAAMPNQQRQARGSRYKDFKVPALPDDGLAPAVRQFIDADEYLDLSDREMDVGKTLTLDPRARPLQIDLSAEASIPQAEIESSAPYQPFHTDRRVSLYEFSGQATTQPSLATLMAETSLEERTAPKQKKRQQRTQQQYTTVETTALQAWAFGQPLNLVKLELGRHSISEDEFNLSDDHRALPLSSMERVMHRGENGDEIVVTTRRRRGARHPEDEDGFFEDDCEVLDFADQRV